MEAESLSLFLASPSGLDEYRRAARECAEQLRRILAVPQGVGFELIGWEDVLPAYGRPQGVINPSLDGCNVLIGILGNRLGTPTGEAESGFVEEFERMAARAREGEEVAILIYTLQLGEDELDDPGEKLQKVIDFRERLSREVLFKEVRSTDHFKAALSLDLVQLIGGIVGRRSQPSEDAAVPTQEGADQPPGPPAEKGDEGAAAAQLRGLFAEVGKVAPDVPEGFRHDRFPLARIALWFTSWQSWLVDNETLGVHELNQVYRARGEAALGSIERRQVLRTICSQPNVAPGWALLDRETGGPLPQLVAFAFGDGEDSVRVGAFRVIDGTELNDWLARADVELDRRLFFARLVELAEDSSEEVRTAMIEFAVRVGGEEARAFLTALGEREIAPQSVLEGKICLEAGADPPAAFALAAEAETELGAATLLAIRGAAENATLEALELITAGKTETVRILAAELLGLRGEEAADALRGLLDDPEDAAALAALSALLAIPDPGIDLAEVGRKLTERKGLRFDTELRLLLARGRPAKDLRDQVSWMDIETAGYYQALAEDHFSEFGEVVRRDLADDFEAFAGESRKRKLKTLSAEVRAVLESPADEVAAQVADEPTAKILVDYSSYLDGSEWNGRRFTVAALHGIAVNGEPADVALVRSRLEAEDAEVREAAAAAIARVGGEEDLARLIELAQARGGEPFARTAVAIAPGPAGVARSLLDTSRRATALLAARHLCAHATELDDETIGLLLHHGIDDVRRIGVAAALAREGDDQALEALLDHYLATESYFYNVVCLLDRVLYSLPTMQRRTRSELASFAAEEQPTPLTSRGDEGPLMSLIRSWSS